MSLRKKSLRGALWSLADQAGRQATSFLVFLVLARLLAPEAFGLVALAGVFVNVMQVLVAQGFGEAIVQRKELGPRDLDTAFWSNLAASVLAVIAAQFGAGPVADAFHKPELANVLRVLSLAFVLSALETVPMALMRRSLDYRRLTVRSLVSVVVGGAAGIMAALGGLGVWSLVVQTLTTAAVAVVALWLVGRWVPRPHFERRLFLEMFSFGSSVLLTKLIQQVGRRADLLLIGYFLSTKEVGYYAVASRFFEVLNGAISTPLSGVAFSAFSRLEGDQARLRRSFLSITEFSGLVIAPAYLGLSLLAPELIRVFFGAAWLPSVPSMQVLGLVGLAFGFTYFSGALIMGSGRPQWQLLMAVIQSTTNVILLALAAPHGTFVVACAYVGRVYLTMPTRFVALRKAIGLRPGPFLRRYGAAVACSAAMAVAVWGLRFVLDGELPPIVLLGVYGCAAVAAYGTTLVVAFPRTLERAWGVLTIDLARTKPAPAAPPSGD